jgi:hypothetical protein
MRCIDIQQRVEAVLPRRNGEAHGKHQGRIARC